MRFEEILKDAFDKVSKVKEEEASGEENKDEKTEDTLSLEEKDTVGIIKRLKIEAARAGNQLELNREKELNRCIELLGEIILEEKNEKIQ